MGKNKKRRKLLRSFVEKKEAIKAFLIGICASAGLYLGFTLVKTPINNFVHDIVLDDLYDHYGNYIQLSDDVTFFENGQHGYITNGNGKKVLRDVKQVVVPTNGNLAWFKSKGLRGFLDVRTGEAVIPAKYKKAWVFSEEGYACVMNSDSTLEFIDTLGNVAIHRQMLNNVKYEEPHKDYYVFHGGHCPIMHNGRVNLINTEGNFILPDFFDCIKYETGFWIARDANTCKVFESSTLKEIILPEDCTDAAIIDSKIIISLSDGTMAVADSGGKILIRGVYNDVNSLTYNDGFGTIENAECYQYKLNDKFGLLDAHLKKITPPIYEYISALDKTHYLCEVATNTYIVINEKGNIVE